jgi:hypothetical protein
MCTTMTRNGGSRGIPRIRALKARYPVSLAITIASDRTGRRAANHEGMEKGFGEDLAAGSGPGLLNEGVGEHVRTKFHLERTENETADRIGPHRTKKLVSSAGSALRACKPSKVRSSRLT